MKDKNWIYYEPVFESEDLNPMMLKFSPWAGHKRFAYDYVRNIKPGLIVELGSYYGCSAFSFLQAIKDSGLGISFYAIDTWVGDDYTQNDYKEDIYGAYKAINDECFSNTGSHMLRMTFDEASLKFEENSIDLLHIDGSHSYEDVKHDFYTWKNKLKSDAVVFFHDVGKDLLYGKEMGSHIFWEELKQEYPFNMEFGFSNGLGILFMDESSYLDMSKVLDLKVYQSYINLQDSINKDELRKAFFIERDLNVYNDSLKSQINVLNEHLNKYEDDEKAKQSYISDLEKRLLDMEELKSFAEQKTKFSEHLQKQLSDLEEFLGNKESYILELEAQKRELEEFSLKKESYVAELEQAMESLKSFSEEKEAKFLLFVKEKESYISELKQQLEELNNFANEKSAYIEELLLQRKELNEFALSKDAYIKELEERVLKLNEVCIEREKDFKKLQDYAKGFEEALESSVREKSDLCAKLDKDDETIKLLTDRIRKLPFGRKLLEGIINE